MLVGNLPAMAHNTDCSKDIKQVSERSKWLHISQKTSYKQSNWVPQKHFFHKRWDSNRVPTERARRSWNPWSITAQRFELTDGESSETGVWATEPGGYTSSSWASTRAHSCWQHFVWLWRASTKPLSHSSQKKEHCKLENDDDSERIAPLYM